MTTVAVIDYGMGNLRSVSKAVEQARLRGRLDRWPSWLGWFCKTIEWAAPNATVKLTASAGDIERADRVVFPGQGAIGACMTALDNDGLRDAVVAAMRNKPFLGICLGLQALYARSEEGGGTACLNILPGGVKRFNLTDRTLKVPHMGWSQVHQERAHPLWKGIEQGARFYFVHSYYADSTQPQDIAGTTEYGLRFTSAAARDNMFAVQFHPEKSQRAGLRLLENFVSWNGNSH